MNDSERRLPPADGGADKLPWEPPILREYSLEEAERIRPGLVEELRKQAAEKARK
ncbi:hypothetical protein ABIE65_004894 [Constrictibacter sp. MBR-5]|jgi:hypothetical protein|uniref:hypothetical protein n=1 Tax=Constrictibacter sp. MBR-5 TaxID=3156467 RepID=UPI00339218B2